VSAAAAAVTGALAEQMSAILGARNVVSDEAELSTYECDGLTGFRVRPGLVILPESADEIGERKIEHVSAAKADALASANPGCLLQIDKHLRRRGVGLPSFPPIEILDASIAGRPLGVQT
jgi:Fe-S oxidoreductase